MKECRKCGQILADEVQICPSCGERLEATKKEAVGTKYAQESIKDPGYASGTAPQKPKMRKSMLIATIVCIIFALVSFFDSIAILFIILAAMFYVLGISPKESKNVFFFGKPTKIKKSLFVIVAVVIAFMAPAFCNSFDTNNNTAQSPQQTAQQIKDEKEAIKQQQEEVHQKNDSGQKQEAPAVSNTNNTKLADVEKWYNAQLNPVANALVNQANSYKEVSNTKVTNKKLIFGDPWGEVYYSLQFTCNVNGVKHSGEARGFLPYGGDTIEWFHFEIFGNNSNVSVVEYYDDDYDDIVADYYKKLVETYK